MSSARARERRAFNFVCSYYLLHTTHASYFQVSRINRTKMYKLPIILSTLAPCYCVYVYSSFWAPLYDQRILNYRVDANFDENSGKTAREEYARNYGYRGETLIANLGSGKGPTDAAARDKVYGDVSIQSTYPRDGNTNRK